MTTVYENIRLEKYQPKSVFVFRDSEALKNYRDESSKLIEVFKNDLETEFGLVGNPKADKLFQLAWEHGHSSGFSEVASYYSEFSELIK